MYALKKDVQIRKHGNDTWATMSMSYSKIEWADRQDAKRALVAIGQDIYKELRVEYGAAIYINNGPRSNELMRTLLAVSDDHDVRYTTTIVWLK